MKNQKVIKLFVVLIFSTAFIFSFSYFGAEAFGSVIKGNGKFSAGTSIGLMDISGKTEIEALSLLEEKFVDWSKGTNISLAYQEETVPFDMSEFHLDAQQTIASIKDGQKNIASIKIDKEKVEEQLQILFPQLNSNDFDVNKLTNTLNRTASNFETGTYNFDLYSDFLLADQIKKDAVLSSAELQLKSVPDDLQRILEGNSSIEINGASEFSLLTFIKEKKLKIEPESLNIIATGIYQAVLPSNINIVERNISSSLPNFAKLGYEAKANQKQNTDLIISNPNKGKVFVDFKLEGNLLFVDLKGEQLLYNYKITVKDSQKLLPKTIIQYSPLLQPGKTAIQNKGTDGQIADVFREVYQGEQLVKSELISEDYYPPVYRVETHALEGLQNQTAQTNTQTDTTASNQISTSSVTQTSTSTNTQAGTSTTSQSGDQTSTGSAEKNAYNSNLWGQANQQPK
jgi:hypothetical protein